ncbi:MAG: mechanosensitive ion channel domain-containing protein [Bacteroidia bacterium]
MLLPFSHVFAEKFTAHPPKKKVEPTVSIKDTLVSRIVKRIEMYSLTIKTDNNLVQRKIQMEPMLSALPEIERRLNAFTKRLAKKGDRMNLRSLNSGMIILKEMASQLKDYETTLSDYYMELSESNDSLKRISTDAILNSNITDSILNNQTQTVLKEAAVLDSAQKDMLGKISIVRNKNSVAALQTEDIMSEMTYLTTTAKKAMWEQEDNPLLQDNPSEYDQSFTEIIENAFTRSGKIISIFLRDKWDLMTMALFLFICISTWCFSNMRRVKKLPNATEVLEPIYFLRRSVLIGCIMAFFTYLPFFFANPQMSFLHVCELLRLLALSFLLFPYLSRSSKPMWIALCLIWVYYAMDDLLLEQAFEERWALVAAGVLLIFICLRIIFKKQTNFVKVQESPGTKALSIFSMTLGILSLVFNFTGRVTLAKIVGIAAVQSLVLGITLKVFSTMVLEAIYLQSEAYKASKFSDLINYNELQHRLRRVLWMIASVVWFIALLVNITLYDYSKELFIAFFETKRIIGNMTFTYESVAVFVLIIWVSSIISGIINFLFGQENSKNPKKKTRIGSMLLLIRLAIWSVGFVVAVAAAGIPMDRISIMIGALGVGIGFGLQNITNNLVSGIILAFERPIQVGDQIEIGDKAGVVDEIGVRSSKIKSSDGSHVIVPNGDLLSQHLTNWTKENSHKNVFFNINISYQSDMTLVKKIICETIEKDKGILAGTTPSVSVQAFADTAIQLKISFWVSDLSKANSLRSDIMLEVYRTLTEKGIRLPYTS